MEILSILSNLILNLLTILISIFLSFNSIISSIFLIIDNFVILSINIKLFSLIIISL